MRLKRPPSEDIALFPEDIARFQRVIKAAGHEASDDDLAWAWAEWSENHWCASWFSVPHCGDEEILRGLMRMLVEA